MTDDSESVALRPTVIDGQRQEDDYEVIWRGLPIGRIMKPPSEPHWWWGCNVYGKPPAANDRGPGINFKDCQLRFKIAWTRIRAGLTEEDISIAARHAEKLAEQQSSNIGEQPKTGELRNLENNRAALRQRVLRLAPSSSAAAQLIVWSGTFPRPEPRLRSRVRWVFLPNSIS
jgi:hypothetical protein